MLWVLKRIASGPEGGHVAILIDHHLHALKVDTVFELNKSLNKYSNIPKLYVLVVYSCIDFLGYSVACANFGTNIQ